MGKFIRVLTIVAVFVALLGSHASGQQKITIRLADTAFDKFSYREAVDLYQFAYQKDTTNAYLIRRIADCHRNMGNTEDVEVWIKKLIAMDQALPEDLFNLAMALKTNSKYEESEAVLKEFAVLKPEDGRVNIQQSLLDYVRFLLDDSTRYVISTVPFNTKGADFGPTVYDNKIVFASTGNPDDNRELKYNWDALPFLDIYYADVLPNNAFSGPKIFSSNLKTSFHEGPATFDAAANRIYFNGNRSSKNASSKSNENNLQIYYADRENGDWVFKGGFKYNDPSYNLRHPSIDAKGEIMFFASDMPGGKGGNDIYWCRKENGEWSEPVNLEYVNSEGDEVFPWIAPDGVLYFSSNGHGGMGGLDVWMAIPDRGVYTKIENMGYPLNTTRDDFGIVLDEVGMNGFFSSNRPGGLGHDDIYQVQILWIPVQIRGTVRDRLNTYEIAGATVSLLDESGSVIETAVTKEDGEFQFKAYKQRNYKLKVEKPEFIGATKDVSTFNKLPNAIIDVELFIEMDFSSLEAPDDLDPLSLENVDGDELQIIQIEHVSYDYDRSNINAGAAIILDKIVALMKQYPNLEIIIESHTDSKGSDEYNLKLSKERAASAFKYLTGKGIDAKAIEYTGFGETQLLNHCEDGEECSEEEHALNRRSIVKVVRRGQFKTKRSSRSMFYF